MPDRRQVLAMLSAALAVSCGGAAHADATDEEAVANKELVKEVVDKTKPAAPGEGSTCTRCRQVSAVRIGDDLLR